MQENECFEQLRNAIEAFVERKMKSPRDFDFLAQAIFDKTRQSISSSTLKRFWGYTQSYASIRVSTLDLLAQFIDYSDYDDFCASAAGSSTHDSTSDTSAVDDSTHDSSPDAGQAVDPSDGSDESCKPGSTPIRKHFLFLAALMVFLLAGAVLLWSGVFDMRAKASSADGCQYILRRGQLFDTSSDYLRLFGITNAEHYWDQPLPHHDGIIIWGPEYHHPQWHNEGERDSLMPTITEWWTPADGASDSLGGLQAAMSEAERQLLIAERNEHLYFTVMRTNELRITFMKNLTDTGYVFLGVYRTDLEQSDSTHVVWERVADECDLRNLTYLQQLRH